MRVADIMVREVVTINPSASMEEAVLKMSENKIGSLIVLENYQIVGVLTEREVIKNIKQLLKEAGRLHVRDLMSKKIIGIGPDKEVEEAARLMAREDIKKLPVVDNGKLVGIVTDTDILKSGEKLEEAVARNIVNLLGYSKGKLHPAY